MTGYAGFTREHEVVFARTAKTGHARVRAVKYQGLLLAKRRRAARKAQWANSGRVAKKRLRQLVAKVVNHRFSWSALIVGQVCTAVLSALLLFRFFPALDLAPTVPAAESARTASPAGTPTAQPVVPTTPEQPMTEQCRLDAPAQLYPSDTEDGVALRFEPSLSPVSSTQPMESTP